ncbi:MAG TPA: hypothetical protein VFD90_05045 [Gaiellales bacterium]|jgi:hypothetical protein|nr:hypothetical protein [Gaiellales bacterium]
MARHSFLVAAFVAVAALLPASAHAVSAASAPTLTSALYASPVTISWTPGTDPLNLQQTVLRAPGACASPPSGGQPLQTFSDNTTSSYSDTAQDGTWCYYIQTTDFATGVAYSPGLTVLVDTLNPSATVAVSGMSPNGDVAGTVGVSGTAADAGSGVESSVLHVGPVGACATGPVVGAQWDTTTVANGPYQVCNVVTDKLGHVAIAVAAVTVANGAPPPPPPPAVDPLAPQPPTKVSVTRARSKSIGAVVTLTLNWVKPPQANLASVLVVLNLDHAPKRPADGTKLYRGLGTSAKLTLRPGETGYLALYSYVKGGSFSPPARTKVSLASLIPLRPLTGSVVHAPPLLTWKAKQGSAYYNLQLYRNGRRVLVVWPARASYRVPASRLTPGTYVWYVWPAVRRGGAAPTFASLIGRATFVFRSP